MQSGSHFRDSDQSPESDNRQQQQIFDKNRAFPTIQRGTTGTASNVALSGMLLQHGLSSLYFEE